MTATNTNPNPTSMTPVERIRARYIEIDVDADPVEEFRNWLRVMGDDPDAPCTDGELREMRRKAEEYEQMMRAGIREERLRIPNYISRFAGPYGNR